MMVSEKEEAPALKESIWTLAVEIGRRGICRAAVPSEAPHRTDRKPV